MQLLLISDLSNWNVSNVKYMSSMFYNATSLISDLSNWNTNNITTMNFMFLGANSLTSDLSNWNKDTLINAFYRNEHPDI